MDDFLKDGFLVFKNQDSGSLERLRRTTELSLGVNSLSSIHDEISVTSINEKRLDAFRALNQIEEWDRLYKSIASDYIDRLIGPDVAIQSKLNLSIQMPGDDTSLLQLHTDALSGQSLFEVVLWVPLTDCEGSNSMYIFNKSDSKSMLLSLSSYEESGMLQMYEENKERGRFMKLSYGDCLLFSPTLFHGNTINKTERTRVSINCRFKNVFSPESASGERRLGSFYKVLQLSPLTRLGLDYRDDLVLFE